jgi:hypothetical protein
MERRAQRQNRLIVFLAIITLCVGGLQVWVALSAEYVDNLRDEKREHQELNQNGKNKDGVSNAVAPAPTAPQVKNPLPKP